MIDDERLLAELREAVLAAREVPAEFVAAGKAAFAWRTLDAELAALSDAPSAAEALAGTRTEHAGVRALSFHASEIMIELEVTPDAVLGQLVPPQPAQIEVQSQGGGKQEITADETGWFAIRPRPTSTFRLHLGTTGTSVITEWVVL